MVCLEVKKLFTTSGAAAESQNLMKEYTEEAFRVLDSLELKSKRKQILIDFANQLLQRKF